MKTTQERNEIPSEVTLLSLAMLKIKIDAGGDYLNYLKPFVMQCLHNSEEDATNNESIENLLRTNFGLAIPSQTVKIILKRIAKEGFIKKEDKVYKINRNKINEDEISAAYNSEKEAAMRHIHAVSESLVKFAKDSAEIEITRNKAMDAFLQFLSKFSIPYLKLYLRGTALPDHDFKEDKMVVLVSNFIKKLHNDDPERLDSFMLLATGNMLKNALLCPDLQSIPETYKDVVFYFDTTLLLQCLGLMGHEKERAILGLVSLIQKLHGRVKCFSHTLEEMIGVIVACARHVDSPYGRGAVVYAAREAGRTMSDLFLSAEKAQNTLEEKKIEVDSTPKYDKKFQIDESALEKILDDHVNYYHETKAKFCDINSVRSIYVLRKKHRPRSVEKSTAIFVTDNSSFAHVAYKYGMEIDQLSKVSAVITDFSLFNLAWLKAPLEAKNLPQEEVIAFSYAMLRPSNAFLEKVLIEADKLQKDEKISARDHQLLRGSSLFQSELMNLTLGEDEKLGEKSITTALKRMSQEIKREETEKLEQEKSQHRETRETKEQLEAKLEAELKKNLSIRKKIRLYCERAAECAANIFSVVVIVLLIMGFWGGIVVKSEHSIVSAIIKLGVVVVAALSFLNLLLGTTIKNLRSRMKSKIKMWLYHAWVNKLGIGDD